MISKSNFVLRKVLNKEENLDVVKDFIENILKINIKNITLNRYPEKNTDYLPKEENFGIINVSILKDDNTKLNVGIQILDGDYIQNKLLLYYAQVHTNQLENSYEDEITKTVTINILHFNCFKNESYHQIIKIKENDSEEEIELHTIELEKFNNKNIIENKEDAWVAYLQGSNNILINYSVEKFFEIQKLDRLLDEYWKNEKME